MAESGGPVAGHSVGKTLLMRLIRYTLGEPHFGSDDTEAAIAETLETAIVVGQWRVAGDTWCVVRPLRHSEAAASYAVATESWQTAVDSPAEKKPLSDFVAAIEQAVLGHLPSITLPRGRDAKWLDVLAWLARDYQCGYRRANDWRHEEANSGPSLDREENSQIMQWLLGLMSQAEVDLKVSHRELLAKQAQFKREEEGKHKKLDALRPDLWKKLGLDEDTEATGGQQTLDAVNPLAVVKDKLRSLEDLKEERMAESQLKQLEEDRDAAQERLGDAKAARGSSSGVLLHLTRQIEEYEKDPLKPYARCRAEPTCWMKQQAANTAADPAKDHHLEDLRSQVEETKKLLAASENEVEACVKAMRESNERVAAERRRISQELSGIDESIGKWGAFQADAHVFQSYLASASKAAASLKSATKKVDRSLKTQDDERERHRHDVDALSSVYQDMLRRIFGDKAEGTVQVSANGLQPLPDRRLAPTGAAMSVMTTVLAFDLACLAASVYGVGQHPRFLIHDSPREGEMQPPLFHKLFEVVINLEKECDTLSQPNFQYILTTASELPEEIRSEELPYVRETLHGLDESGLLLRSRF